MSMIDAKFTKSLLALLPLLRALSRPAAERPSPRHALRVNMEELPVHMQRDIGLLDGHATPARHAAGRERPTSV